MAYCNDCTTILTHMVSSIVVKVTENKGHFDDGFHRVIRRFESQISEHLQGRQRDRKEKRGHYGCSQGTLFGYVEKTIRATGHLPSELNFSHAI